MFVDVTETGLTSIDFLFQEEQEGFDSIFERYLKSFWIVITRLCIVFIILVIANALGLDLCYASSFVMGCILQSSELILFWVILPFLLSPVTTSEDSLENRLTL